MRTRHGLTTAALGILAALAAFAGCKSSTGGAGADGGGDQRAVSGAQRPPACNLVCATAQDCGGTTAGLEDASHFQCTGGRCQWQGCKSKAECTAAYQSDNVICAKEGGAPVADCIHVCTAAADCAGQSPSDDASHYACTGGRCEWLGCKSNAECATAFQDNKFICVKENGAPVPGCVLACNAPADCASPGGEGPAANRFTCTNHRCAWLGCASTDECKALYHSQKMICE